tara:strand:+ start:2048 stop:2749 length:702 start_codon:yes stop_codon:yes gene_type:complete
MVSYGIIDLYDADTGILVHKQVIYRLEGKIVHLYRPTTLEYFENKVFNIFSTLSSVDPDFFFSIPLRALIDVTVHYLPSIFNELNTGSLCDNTKISILETAFSNKVLNKLLKKQLNSFFYGKSFAPNQDKNGVKLSIVEQIKGYFPKHLVFFKNEENDTWTVINTVTDVRNVADQHIKLLDSEIYRYYIKKNYKKIYRHYFSHKNNNIIVKSQCELVWFDPPKPSLSLLKNFR